MFRDPIKKAYFIFENNLNFSITLRHSGLIDIYWNMQKVDSSTEADKCSDITMSYDTMYFKKINGEVKSIHTNNDKDARIELAEDIPYSDFLMEKVFY